MSWDHWKNPVIYMSRTTTREVWLLMYGTEPDLGSDLRFGQAQIPVLFDDRMERGAARLDEQPENADGVPGQACDRSDMPLDPDMMCASCGQRAGDHQRWADGR